MQSNDNLMDSKHLFDEFKSVPTEQWQAAIQKFLKDKPLDSLTVELEKELNIHPVQRADQHYFEHSQGIDFPSDWWACSYLNITSTKDLKTHNQTLLDALSRGANALILRFDILLSLQELQELFDQIQLSILHLHVELNFDTEQQLAFIQHLQLFYGQEVSNLSINLLNQQAQQLNLIGQYCTQHLSLTRYITVAVESGSSIALAKAFHDISLLIDLLLNQQFKIDHILQAIRIEYPVGLDYFKEIACMRAIRILWNALLQAYQPSQFVDCFLHVVAVMQNNDDPYQNMIKASTQSMSAAIAGANSIYVQPSKGINTDDAFSKRIALNVHHILKSESHFDKISDPAAGAFYIEKMTKLIADKAWQQFCSYE